MLMQASHEFGKWDGLGVIEGSVVPIPLEGRNEERHKIPHIGWNELIKNDSCPWDKSVLAEIQANSAFYFVHSFMVDPKLDANRLASCDYNGINICAAIKSGNTYGMQFHPEKSGDVGLNLLRRFIEL